MPGGWPNLPEGSVTSLLEFFAMGGYAFYVWTSYALTAVLLVGIVGWSARQLKSTQQRTFRRARQPRGKS